MLRTLLAKDLRRAVRNPVPWLVSLVVPFVITGLLGAMFGPRGGGQPGLGTIRVALVDEDNSGVGDFLTGMLEQVRTSEERAEAPFQLDLATLPREEAVRRTTWGEFAAVVVLPKGFTDSYFETGEPVSLEIIKNPAQAIHPRVVEETLGLLASALNAVRDVAGDQLGDIRNLIRSEDDTLTKMALAGSILVEARSRLEPVKEYLVPPLVAYTEETRDAPAPANPSQGRGIFPFLMAGMAGMFLLYLVDNAMRDLYREMHARTLERFQTLHESLLAFIGSKICYAIAMGLIGAVILLGGSAVVFRFTWQQPLLVTALVVAYAFCGAGLLGLFAALAGTERRADALANISIMGMAMLGGCMFPPQVLPAFMREWIVPVMPTNWFAAAVRGLQDGSASNAWILSCAKLLVLGAVTLWVASSLFRRRLARGVRA